MCVCVLVTFCGMMGSLVWGESQVSRARCPQSPSCLASCECRRLAISASCTFFSLIFLSPLPLVVTSREKYTPSPTPVPAFQLQVISSRTLGNRRLLLSQRARNRLCFTTCLIKQLLLSQSIVFVAAAAAVVVVWAKLLPNV